MPLPSLVFLLLFLPLCGLLYFAFSFSRRVQNVLLLLASLIFYTCGQTSYILVLLFSILWNYAMGASLGARREKGGSTKAVAAITISVNILIWAAFQLVNRALGTLLPMLGQPAPAVQIAAPLGLAWLTLRACGYCLDVYRGEISPEKNPLYLGLYLSFFPAVTMGPFVEYTQMRRQMLERTHSLERVCEGLCRFILGLAKKLLLADQLSYLVNYLFTQAYMDKAVSALPVALSWLGLLAFSLQLYYELSGFADMAIGLSRVFGFDLPENYRLPFAANSITDFWRRFNITGLAWFRKYVFGILPDKQSADMLLRNLFITWVLFGLWVGGLKQASLLWGLWNYMLLVSEYFLGHVESGISSFVKRLYTLLAVGLGLVLLKSPTLFNAGQYYGHLFGLKNNGFWNSTVWVFLREYWLVLAAGIFFAGTLPQKLAVFIRRPGKPLKAALYAFYPLCMACLLVLCLACILRGLAVYTPVY